MEDTTQGLCGKCGRKTEWSIGHGIYTDNFSNRVHIAHMFVCKECGIRVKEQSWQTYQRIMRERLGYFPKDRIEEA